MPPLLEVKNLRLEHGERVLVHRLNWAVERGEIWAILGPNGAGKTTLLKTLAGERRPASGWIRLDGMLLDRYPDALRAQKVAYVPQEAPQASALSVWEVLKTGRLPYTRFGRTPEIPASFEVLSDWFQLDALLLRTFDTLSGGEKRRVLLARAFLQDASLMLLDEPFAELDWAWQQATIRILKKMAREAARSFVVVLHDLTRAAQLADGVVLLPLTSGEKSTSFAPRVGSVDEVLTQDSLKAFYEVSVDIIPHPTHGKLLFWWDDEH
ncbi:MAG: ABC transporter ATP-binding protein [Candidatus Carbobacillus altaicus]|uniref:Vitamin B12 ABC transporter, ATPase component BtuD n=1 Tax=Candidatus Carbonibacillus altaicus TaxID=2163959 RepID=A0A2R6Y2W2_9BACL|nr:ABC transporter ATP-binding protein [Candidatus Carbobacillus altaicus]PTQ57026.1 MAG: Vitamin B12 ABC transporter, ATPase component BtuD [Candidatus Carbobacillus altaicus]